MGDKMRKWIIAAAVLCTAALSLIGCYIADAGAKKVGGYFDENIVAAIERQQQKTYLVLFNRRIRIF